MEMFLKRLSLFLLLTIPAFAQTFSGHAGSSVYVPPPFQLCVGDEFHNGCWLQTANGTLFNGTLLNGASNLPNADNAFDLGSAILRWRTGYFGTSIINSGTETTSGPATFSGGLTSSSVNGVIHVCPTCTNTTLAAAITALGSTAGTIEIDDGVTLTVASTVTFPNQDITLIMHPNATINCTGTSGDCIQYGAKTRIIGVGPGFQVMGGPVIQTSGSAALQNIIGPATAIAASSSGFSMMGVHVSHASGTLSRAVVDICCADNATNFSYNDFNVTSGTGTFSIVLLDGVNVNNANAASGNQSGTFSTNQVQCNNVAGCTPLQFSGNTLATSFIANWKLDNNTFEYPGAGLNNIKMSSTKLNLWNIEFQQTHMERNALDGDFVLCDSGCASVKFNNISCYTANGSTSNSCVRITDTQTQHPTDITVQEMTSSYFGNPGSLNFVKNDISGQTITPGATQTKAFLPSYVYQNSFWGTQGPFPTLDSGLNILGNFQVLEVVAPTGVANSDLLWGDSTAHRLKMNNNNGGAKTVAFLEGDTFTTPNIGAATGTSLTLGSASINGSGAATMVTYNTTNNCAVNSASPAACGSAPAGAFVVPTTTTSYTVNTTAVDAASRIFLMPMSFAGNLPSSPTCVAPAVTSAVTISAISAATSFTMALPSTTGQTCWQYWIIN